MGKIDSNELLLYLISLRFPSFPLLLCLPLMMLLFPDSDSVRLLFPHSPVSRFGIRSAPHMYFADVSCPVSLVLTLLAHLVETRA